MYQVEQLIIKALNIVNNNMERAEAEKKVFQLLQQNPSQFFYHTAEIVGNTSKDPRVRQSASSVIKSLLVQRDQNNTFYWDKVDINLKPKIKDMLIMTLIEPEAIIMRAGANAIASIAAIQIPRQEWLDIIDTLAQNTMHEGYNIRKASITTLGFICQQLNALNMNINYLACTQILGAIIIGLRDQTSQQIIQISLIALRDSIAFLKQVLEDIKIRNQTINVLLDYINTQNYSKKAYQIFFQLGKHCYHLIGGYMKQIVIFTQKHIQARDQISISALQLWDTIGTEYLQQRTNIRERVDQQKLLLDNYIQDVHVVILPEIMNAILILSKKDLVFAQLRESAVKALTSLVECGNRQLFDKITEGTSRIIQSANAGQRQASALFFGCLCQYGERAYTENCFVNGFSHLYGLLNDPEQIVRKNTLNGFVTLSDSFPQVFMRHNDIISIVKTLLVFSNDKDEDTRILSLTILCNITEIVKDFIKPLATDPDILFKPMINSYSQTLKISPSQSKQTNQKITIIIMNLAMACDKREIIIHLIDFLIDQYMAYTGMNVQDKQIILESIMAILHTCVLALAKFINAEQIKPRLYNLLQLHMQNYGVQIEGINMISGFSNCFKRGFTDKVQYYWSYVLQGLQMVDQKPLFRASLSCIADLARIHEYQIVNKTTQVFNRLLAYMHGNIDRELKTQILKCFGDLALGLKRYGQNFIDTLINISTNCFQAVLKFSQIESEKTYAQELKQTLIEMYHCLMFAVNQQKRPNDKLGEHYELLASFIVKSCDVKFRPTVEYLKNCVYLLYDSALFYTTNPKYKHNIQRILDSNQICNLLRTLQKYSESRTDVRQLFDFLDKKIKKKLY